MTRWEIEFRDGEPPRELGDLAELDALLDRVSSEAPEGRPTGVHLFSPEGACLTLALGSEESVLGFIDASCEPPYFASKGEVEDVEPLFTFYVCSEHHTEVPRRNVVSTGAAREAAREFFRTGRRPENVAWEET